jgi:ketosteroid isomerase-like protein
MKTADEIGKRTVQLFDAMKAHDVAAIDQLMTRNFVFTTFAGTTGTRAQYLEVVEKKIMQIEAYELRPICVEEHGDAAVALYVLGIRAHANGQPWPSPLVSSDFWVKQGGEWKLASRHSSVVMQQR